MKKTAVKKINENSISLNKYVSATGFCSRRQADKFIADGRVTLNGEVGTLGNRVFEGDIVQVDGETIRSKKRPLYIAFNKPVGIVCTTEYKEKDNIISYINHPQRLFPIGRLDKPSEGLIFLTNDGDIVNKILRAGNRHEKEYMVTVKQAITPEFIQKMREGVPLEETVTQKCKVTKVTEFVFKITLTQGLNRQIRRMCQALGYNVSKLKRTRIMNVTLGSLKLGQWRELTSLEMQEINLMVSSSSKTEEASEDENKRRIKTSKRKRNSKNLPISTEKELKETAAMKSENKPFVGKKTGDSSKGKKGTLERGDKKTGDKDKKIGAKKKFVSASKKKKEAAKKPKSSAKPRRNKMVSKKLGPTQAKKKK
ncbi:MAG: 23S rRNA pseudouridine(2604) synthase RluF [Chitinophagales bacterium]